MPTVSVVIPLYNKEHCIGRTLESVLAQTCADLEVVVVNDGSTDGSLHMVEGIRDERVRIVSKPNEGVSATRNRGMREAQGDCILLLDADDSLRPNALQELTALQRRFPDCGLYAASFVETNEHGEVVKQKLNAGLGVADDGFEALWTNRLCLRFGNMMFRRSLLDAVGDMRTDLTLYEDKEWLHRLLHACGRVAMSPEVVMEYRREPTGLSHKPVAIERDFVGILRLQTVKHPHEKRLLADFIARRLLRRLLSKDLRGAWTIARHNLKHLPYCFWTMGQRLL